MTILLTFAAVWTLALVSLALALAGNDHTRPKGLGRFPQGVR